MCCSCPRLLNETGQEAEAGWRRTSLCQCQAHLNCFSTGKGCFALASLVLCGVVEVHETLIDRRLCIQLNESRAVVLIIGTLTVRSEMPFREM
jgi:hypothetical protein